MSNYVKSFNGYLNESFDNDQLGQDFSERFGVYAHSRMWGSEGIITIQQKRRIDPEEFSEMLNWVESQGYLVNTKQSYGEFESDDDRYWYPRIVFNKTIEESIDSVPADFKVDDYEILDNSITVLCYFPHETDVESYDEVVIDRDDFESWVGENINLDWTDDYYDPSDFYGHGQKSGTLTIEDWWNEAEVKEIYGALESYIKEKGIEVRPKFDHHMDVITKTQMDHDEAQLRREQGL